MSRSIEEIYHLIIEKKENAENHIERIYKEIKKDEIKEQHYDCIYQKLKGEIKAYTDILILLETSGVVENEVVR